MFQRENESMDSNKDIFFGPGFNEIKYLMVELCEMNDL